jgi:hypothetical protein
MIKLRVLVLCFSYFFAGFFFESHPVYDQTQGSGALFFLLYR